MKPTTSASKRAQLGHVMRDADRRIHGHRLAKGIDPVMGLVMVAAKVERKLARRNAALTERTRPNMATSMARLSRAVDRAQRRA
jgi:hypothetical protein